MQLSPRNCFCGQISTWTLPLALRTLLIWSVSVPVGTGAAAVRPTEPINNTSVRAPLNGITLCFFEDAIGVVPEGLEDSFDDGIGIEPGLGILHLRLVLVLESVGQAHRAQLQSGIDEAGVAGERQH